MRSVEVLINQNWDCIRVGAEERKCSNFTALYCQTAMLCAVDKCSCFKFCHEIWLPCSGCPFFPLSLTFWLEVGVPCFRLPPTRWPIFLMVFSLCVWVCVCVCVCVFSQIREEFKLTSISTTRLAFISSTGVHTVRRTGRHERVGECQGDKRNAQEKTCCLSARWFCAYQSSSSSTFSLSLFVRVRRSWVIKTPTFSTRSNKSN